MSVWVVCGVCMCVCSGLDIAREYVFERDGEKKNIERVCVCVCVCVTSIVFTFKTKSAVVQNRYGGGAWRWDLNKGNDDFGGWMCLRQGGVNNRLMERWNTLYHSMQSYKISLVLNMTK
jgi:hypothetical protein